MASDPPREPIRSTVDSSLDKAIKREADNQGDSEASQHIEKFNEKDTQRLKIIGGVVAAVAAIALGGIIIKKRKSKKEKAKEESQNLLDEAGKRLKGSGRWIGDKAGTVKEKAGEFAGAVGNVTDDVGPRVKGAAITTKEKVVEVIPDSVTNTVVSIKDRANVTGIKAEKEGLKASEKSDAAVRETADKVIHESGKAARKIDEKSGGFFSQVQNWLADRKDDAGDLASQAASKIGEAASKAGNAIKGK